MRLPWMKKPKTEDKASAKDWLDSIERAKKVRNKWWGDQRIDTALLYWEGVQRQSQFTEEEWITVNLFYATIMAELPTLYAADPEFFVRLKKSYKPDPNVIGMYEEQGRMRAAYLNYLTGELNLKEKARQGIFDALFSYGVLKVQTNTIEVPNPHAGQVVQVEGMDMLDENGEPVMEPDTITTDVKYSITRVHPSDFLVDEDAGPIYPDDVKWVAHRIRKSVSEVQKDKRYDKKARDTIKATELSSDLRAREQKKKGSEASTSWAGGDKKKPDVVVLWEVYDLQNEQWFTVAEGNDSFLRAPEELPPGVEGDPFAVLRYTRRDDSWYPVSCMGQLVDSQREYCETRSYQLRHRKNISSRIYTLEGQAFDDPSSAADQLATGGDGTVIVVQRSIGFPAINPVKDAPLDNQLNIELAYLKADFAELAVGSNQRGSGSGIDSATEAGILEQRARLREADRKQFVAEWLMAAAKKLDQQIQATITDDLAVRITGPRGDAWQFIKQTDYAEIEGEYQYDVSVGSALPNMPEIERAQLVQFLATIAQAPQMLTAPALTRKLAETFGLENEAIIQELLNLGKMLAGQPAGGMASIPGVPEEQPMQEVTGAANGVNNIRGGLGAM